MTTLFFVGKRKTNPKSLEKIFDMYQKASGQMINMDKSTMVFSKNVDAYSKSKIIDWMSINNTNIIGNYLGLPTQIIDLTYKILTSF